MAHEVFIALGANQNAIVPRFGANTPSNTSNTMVLTPSQSFRRVVDVLHSKDIEVTAVSGIWQSPAWPDPTLPPYKNAVISVETNLSAPDLLDSLKQIENEFGRDPLARRNASRPLDLDILDYKGAVMNSENLVLPHPRMLDRGFVLLPLQEIAPTWRDPIKKRAVQNWIARLPLSATHALNWTGRFY